MSIYSRAMSLKNLFPVTKLLLAFSTGGTGCSQEILTAVTHRVSLLRPGISVRFSVIHGHMCSPLQKGLSCLCTEPPSCPSQETLWHARRGEGQKTGKPVSLGSRAACSSWCCQRGLAGQLLSGGFWSGFRHDANPKRRAPLWLLVTSHPHHS